MFRSFIYLDTDKLFTYKRQLDGVSLDTETVEKREKLQLGASINGIGIRKDVEKNTNGNYKADANIVYDAFEKELIEKEGDEYFDTVLNEGDDLKTAPQMSLARIHATFYIPEQFDIYTWIEKLRPLLIKNIPTNSADERTAVNALMGEGKIDIPILIDYEDFIISGKLNAKYLLEEYANLEEYENQEVFILCKVIGMMRQNNVKIFDPFKDFIQMPRQFRRQLHRNKEDPSLQAIVIKDIPVLKVEFVAIYK